ncbi:MAG: acyl-CoA dehydrogenase family protein [Betaproteobacteria bacterium]|nr:acyl-CoA dehydrogenase family protein [Betaproteobacteria bacterium]
MDFTLPAPIEAYRRRYRDFVRGAVLPLDTDPSSFDEHQNIRAEVLAGVRAKAKAAGLWAPQMPKERGGQGLGVTGMAACYEELNYSLFGPVSVNCAAPDDGNMILLNKVGTPAQKERWLQPIVDGKVRSAFAMTEPHPGGGSDPAMMLTTATRSGDKWVVRGRKWFITGADEARHFIVVAKTSEDARKGLTAFLFDRDDPGWAVTRRIPILGPEEHGGHCELEFDGLAIPDENRLMNVGDGLKVTQIRLGTARLTHCMRWLGLSRRSLDIAADYAGVRMSGGKRLADRESIQMKLGHCAMQVEIGRLLTMKAATLIDKGDFAKREISMAKVHVADTLHLCADTAIQLCGARGYSTDTPLEWIYRYARQARLVDGATEVHQQVLARLFLEERGDFWRWA